MPPLFFLFVWCGGWVFLSPDVDQLVSKHVMTHASSPPEQENSCMTVIVYYNTYWHDLSWSLVFTVSLSKLIYKANIEYSLIWAIVKTISPQ